MESKEKTFRISLFFDSVINQITDKDRNVDMSSRAGEELQEFDIKSNIRRLYSNLHKTSSTYSKAIYIGAKSATRRNSRNLAESITDFDQNRTNSSTQIALNKIITILKTYSLDHKNADIQLKIDLFGFGSGAAVARNFANLLNFDQEVLDEIVSVLGKSNNNLKQLTFGFIGLFDTIKTDLGNPDKTGINLNLNKVKTDAIFHITAMHEIRDSIPLLSVVDTNHYANSDDLDSLGSSSNRVTNTFEFSVPGAHTDIGGGHNLFEDECHILNPKSTYVAAYLKKSIHTIIDKNLLLAPLFSSIKFEYNLFRGGYTAISRRKNVYGHLQLLYARLMVDTAAKFGVPFDVAQFEDKYTVPNELGCFYNKLLDNRNLLLNVKKFTPAIEILGTHYVQKYVHLPASIRPTSDKSKKMTKISLLSKFLESWKDFSQINNATAD